MSEKKDQVKENEKGINYSPEHFPLRNYFRKHKPYYLTCVSDNHKLETIRKTISETEVVLLSSKDDRPDNYDNASDSCGDQRETDLKNHFPSQANKFINYRRKEKNERERNEVPARKTTIFWQRREKN